MIAVHWTFLGFWYAPVWSSSRRRRTKLKVLSLSRNYHVYRVYTINRDHQWYRCYCTTLMFMASKPDSSKVSVTKPEKQRVCLPSSWFHAVLTQTTRCWNSTQLIPEVSFVMQYVRSMYRTVSILIKSFTASAQCCWPNMTTEHAAAAVLTIAEHWTFPGIWFATHRTVVNFHINPSEVFTNKNIIKITEVSNPTPFTKLRI